MSEEATASGVVANSQVQSAAASLASPGARRLAEEHQVDVATVRGTGPGGRVTKSDVNSILEARTAATSVGSAPASPVEAAKGETTRQELTRPQRRIAHRMAESKATIPDFAATVEVDMESCIRLRRELKAQEAAAPSLNDMIIRACALALREHPRANGSFRDSGFDLHARVNVGFAVSTHDGLMVPVVTDADRKSLGEIAAESRTLAEDVRTGKISPAALAGGTFTVSNLGMFGIKTFTAVVNPPQAAILAVGAVRGRGVVVDGELVVRQTSEMTLSCDHRILYGADAAKFLLGVQRNLEDENILVGPAVSLR